MRIGVAHCVGLAVLGLVAGCGETPADGAGETTATVTKAAAGALSNAVAFTYALGFRAPADRLDDVQRAHEDACEAMGAARCMVLGSTLAGREGRYARGTLDLLAAPQVARALTRQFSTIAGEQKSSLTRSEMTGEALDGALAAVADARTAAQAGRTDAERTLRDGQGTLNRIDAGREAADRRDGANEVAAQTRTLRGRLAASRITVNYESDLPVTLDRGRPLAAAFAQAGADLSDSLAVIVRLVVILGPFALAAALALAGWRRWGQRGRLGSAAA